MLLEPYQFNFEARYWRKGTATRPEGWGEWMCEGECDPGHEEGEWELYAKAAAGEGVKCEIRMIAIREEIIRTRGIAPVVPISHAKMPPRDQDAKAG